MYNQVLRSMIGNSWARARSVSDNDENIRFKWSTKKLHAVCTTIPASDFVKSVQRKYLGHLIRCPDNQARKQSLFMLDKRGFYQKIPLIQQVSKTQNIEKDRLFKDDVNRRYCVIPVPMDLERFNGLKQ